MKTRSKKCFLNWFIAIHEVVFKEKNQMLRNKEFNLLRTKYRKPYKKQRDNGT